MGAVGGVGLAEEVYCYAGGFAYGFVYSGLAEVAAGGLGEDGYGEGCVVGEGYYAYLVAEGSVGSGFAGDAYGVVGEAGCQAVEEHLAPHRCLHEGGLFG